MQRLLHAIDSAGEILSTRGYCKSEAVRVLNPWRQEAASAPVSMLMQDFATGTRFRAPWQDLYNAPMYGGSPADITQLLRAWSEGDAGALDQLTPLVVQELRRIAQNHLRHEHADRTLQATALVNEAYLRLIDVAHVRWEDRAHFFAICSRIMRRILIEAARARLADKRGGGALRVTLDDALPVMTREVEFLALEEALNALAAFDERKARVVELRFFGGLSVEETAHVLKISEQSVHRDWRLARSWLLRELKRA